MGSRSVAGVRAGDLVRNLTGSGYYQNVRDLMCGDRIRLANTFFCFNGLDLRPLLAGSADSEWNDEFGRFVTRGLNLDEAAAKTGGVRNRTVRPEQLESAVATLGTGNELLFLQQGERIGDVNLLTEVAVYRARPHEVRLSELRQGREGFEFELDFPELLRRFRLAPNHQATLYRRDELDRWFVDKARWRAAALAAHNEGTSRARLSSIAEKLRELVSRDPEPYLASKEALPAYFALKFCGPICWYFNLIVQAVYAIDAGEGVFLREQMELNRAIDRQSQICRNLGLMVGLKHSDALLKRTKAALCDLIDHTEQLKELII